MAFQIRQGWYAYGGVNPDTNKRMWIQPAKDGETYDTRQEAEKVAKDLRRHGVKDIKVEEAS